MAMAVIDANVLVGLLDDQDKWHDATLALRDELSKAEVQLVYFDCVINENWRAGRMSKDGPSN